jgi:hypothetical protein
MKVNDRIRVSKSTSRSILFGLTSPFITLFFNELSIQSLSSSAASGLRVARKAN